MSATPSRPNCYGCQFFYITYQPSFPYGCKAMSFKSKILPSVTVYKNSGMECQMYQKKNST